MATFSGRFGTILGIGTVRNWNLNANMNLIEVRASNTKQGAHRKKGVFEWSGSYAAFGGKPAFLPGEKFALELYTHPDSGTTAGDPGKKFNSSGNAIVDEVVITWNFSDTGETIISHTVSFSGEDDLSCTSASSSPDDAPVDAPSVCGASILYEAINPTPIALTAIPAVTQAVLTLTSNNIVRIDSGTIITASANSIIAGTDSACARKFLEGVKEWGLAISRNDNTFYADLGAEGVYELKVSTATNDRWLLKWGMVSEFSNYTVDIENDELISHTTNVAMQALLTTDLDPDNLGQVVKPGDAGTATHWWGKSD